MSSTKGTNLTKDVIYIDVDDEITGIIDKVHGSDKKIVALVLPKRATVMQSVVNMKLLKRGAADAKKNLVLITSEAGLLPLAGSVGIHVAKSLSSKPEIPDAPLHASEKTEVVEESDDDDAPDVDKQKTVGELSGVGAAHAVDDPDETIEMDDDDEPSSDEPAAKGGKLKKLNKKFKIPNFNKFRVMLALGVVGVIVLSMVGYAAAAVWPSAKITIKTDSTAITSNLSLNLKTAPETQLDAEKAILPAQLQEVKKTLTQDVPTTGQLNNGEKATGEIKIINCTSGDSLTIPAGTGVTSAGVTFAINDKVTIPVGSNTCQDFPGATSKTVGITAVSAGAKFNIPAGTFTVSGYSSKTKASSGAATAGGTDSIVKVVSQADVDVAKQKIAELDDQAVRQELKSALIGRDLFALDSTFTAGSPETTLSVEINEPAETLTVSQVINYSMLGVKQEDLEKVISKDAEKKIDTKKQSIIDFGLDEALFTIQGTSPEGATVSLQTTIVAGAELNVDTIKKQVAGKKAGDAREIISANPGVTDVVVEYSPFWVSSIPKKTNKITIVIQEPKVSSEDAESP